MTLRSLLTLIIPLFIMAVALMSLVLMRGGKTPAQPPAAPAEPEKSAAEKGVGYEWAKWEDADLAETESGLQYMDLTVGSGEQPGATSTVSVNYIGKLLTTGKVFDSSYDRDGPAEFPVNKVIAGWTEGLQSMQVGGKRVLVIPANLGYGQTGNPPDIPPGAPLVFEVELLAIK